MCVGGRERDQNRFGYHGYTRSFGLARLSRACQKRAREGGVMGEREREGVS